MILTFAYGVYPFIPAARGGGDYTISPKVTIYLKNHNTTIPSSNIASACKNNWTCPLILVEQTTKGIYTADPLKAGGPEEWRSIGGRKPPLTFYNYDIIAKLEYESRSNICKNQR
jgi:hypothetical protein